MPKSLIVLSGGGLSMSLKILPPPPPPPPPPGGQGPPAWASSAERMAVRWAVTALLPVHRYSYTCLLGCTQALSWIERACKYPESVLKEAPRRMRNRDMVSEILCVGGGGGGWGGGRGGIAKCNLLRRGRWIHVPCLCDRLLPCLAKAEKKLPSGNEKLVMSTQAGKAQFLPLPMHDLDSLAARAACLPPEDL